MRRPNCGIATLALLLGGCLQADVIADVVSCAHSADGRVVHGQAMLLEVQSVQRLTYMTYMGSQRFVLFCECQDGQRRLQCISLIRLLPTIDLVHQHANTLFLKNLQLGHLNLSHQRLRWFV